jgi:pyruvate dehydrogenase E2 component (dihydrolipoamide acetyltransferase)
LAVALPITVPRRGWSMEEGKFAGWLKQDGERVRPGELLFVLESDKAAEEIEALDGGILRLGTEGPKPGDTVTVGQVLGYLAEEGESTPPVRRAEVDAEAIPVLSTQYSVLSTPAPSASRRRTAISPRARRVAAELGVDTTVLAGSGRHGRVRERDVRAAAAAPPAGRLIPHTPVRRTIAARMVAGVTQAAPVTLTTRADATNLVNLRDQFRAAPGPDGLVPGYTDLVVKLAAVALRRHPRLQARWRDDGLFVPDRVDVAVAVDTDAGLFAPVIRDADRLTLRQLAARSRELIARARAGRLTADEMRDATFTVTNLGGLGIDAFTPILHLPQAAVLGVGRIVREPAVHDDRVVPRDRVTLSLTFDHRVVDGAPAARFLDTLRGCLEQPAPHLLP